MTEGPFGNTLKLDAQEFHLQNTGIISKEILDFYEKELNTIFVIVNGQTKIFRRTDY